MNKLTLVFGALAVVSFLSLLLTQFREIDIGKLAYNHKEFAEFKKRYNKLYKSVDEQLYRFNIFMDNLRLIEEINSDSRSTFSAAVNFFADMTYNELTLRYLVDFERNIKDSNKKCTDQFCWGLGSAPDSFNWFDQGKVQDVKAQNLCSSGWAFAAVGAIESAIAIKLQSKVVPNISEQELIDCSSAYGNQGCYDGKISWSFDYVLDHHINNEEDYPYLGQEQTCKTSQTGEGKNSIAGCVKVDPSIEGLVNAIATQPTAVAFYVAASFFFYSKGIYNPWICVGSPNHAVLAVGYDKTDKIPFFILKNSWGADWGELGYFRIAFGKDKGTCEIAGNGLNYYPLA